MSGGAWEAVVGYNTKASTVGGSSGLTTIYENFFSSTEWNKYYDKYSSTSDISYNNRILGDATGEMGSFTNVTDPDTSVRHRSSWYGDFAHFPIASNPWFLRGALWHHGIVAGAFAFYHGTGGITLACSFRVILIP